MKEIYQKILTYIGYGNIKIVKSLLHECSYEEYLDFFLKQSISSSHFELVEFFIELGSDVNSNKQGSPSPLSIAIKYNNPKMVYLLIEAGVDPDKKIFFESYQDPQSPIFIANYNGYTEIVNILREAGADTSEID